MKFEHKSVIVGCLYRHPSSEISVIDFSEKYLEPELDNIGIENKQCILMGDTNVNLLKSEATHLWVHFIIH